MIPIIYESNETSFTTNGLGRLPDCISCVVTEELNGIYELDFSYPVTGENYDLIQLGRIIAVTHDDSGDIQPFDIVGYSKPIDGVVDFHAVHISYRLSRYTAKVPSQTVDRPSRAFTMFQNAFPQDGLWHYSSPGFGDPVAFMASTEDGLPKSVRQFIGGVEGSFLDTFGGEITWDKFNVIFKPSRGQRRDFAIRYGVNMTAYNEETDSQETFAFALPYWTDGTNTVIGSLVDSGLSTYDGHELCVAIDLSDKFETQPTTSQLEAEALAIMQGGQTNLPKRTIEVDFIRLQDLEEYAGFDDLLACELGDTVTVIFPAYNVQGQFRIVKVVWNVLMERFETMTLGALQTTLAEALGISGGSMSYSGGGGGGNVVTWTQIQASGTKIAVIDINGSSTDVYAPTPTALWYGTCTTAGGTAAKAATITGFTDANITTGQVIWVRFSNANSVANPTLSINSGTAIAIKRYGTTAPSTSAASSWNAGEVVTLVYDGTYWMMADWVNTTYSSMTTAEIDAGTGTTARLITPARLKYAIDQWVDVTQVQTTGTKIATIATGDTATDIYAPAGGGSKSAFYGTSSTTASTAEKAVTCADWSLEEGNTITILFSTANTAGTPTLNINSTGAKSIYRGNGAVTASNPILWDAGSTLTFVYDGTYYRFVTAQQDSGNPTTLGAGTWQGTSSTADGTATKVVACDNFNFDYGAIIAVTFSNASTDAAPALRVGNDSTGRPIYKGGSAASALNPVTWSANDTLLFQCRLQGPQNVYDYLGTTGANVPIATSSVYGTVMVQGYYDPPGGYADITTGNNPSVISVPRLETVGAETLIRAKYLPMATDSVRGAVIVDDTIDNASTNPVQNTVVKAYVDDIAYRAWRGTSSTSAATQSKVVTFVGTFDYGYGSLLAVTFSTANTHDTPQINGYPIFRGGVGVDANNPLKWNANTTLLFQCRTYGGGTPCFDFLSSSEEVSSGGGSTATTATLLAANWTTPLNTQTVTVNGVTSSNNVIVSYEPTSREYWLAAGVYCYAQGTNSLSFSCVNIPSVDIDANVLIIS